MLTSTTFTQPALKGVMLVIGLLVLPAAAAVDYLQGYRFTAVVEFAAAVMLFCLVFLIRPLGVHVVVRAALLAAFALAVLGSVEKLGSAPNFAWFTVMPFLYITFGGLGLGAVLTVSHALIIFACYLTFARPVVDAMDAGTWMQVVLAYATAAGLAIAYERTQRRLRLQLRALADHDPLTGLLNRRGMEARLGGLAAFLKRHNVVVTLALLDVDHFKRVNDEHGHDVGDAVLGEIGRELKRVFRESDYLARWGGEEFLVVLTHTDLCQATTVLERVRAEIHGVSVFSVPSITLSMGASEWRPGTDLHAALKQADLALYEAKNKGRNKLVAALGTSPTVPMPDMPRALESGAG